MLTAKQLSQGDHRNPDHAKKYGMHRALWECHCCGKRMHRYLGIKVWTMSFCDYAGVPARMYRVTEANDKLSSEGTEPAAAPGYHRGD